MIENLIVGGIALVFGIAVWFAVIAGVLLAFRLGFAVIVIAPEICDEFIFGLKQAFRGFPRDLRRCLLLGR